MPDAMARGAPGRHGLRILFIAQAVSIHTARWVKQIQDQGWDLHLFDMLGSFPHPELQGITEYSLLFPRKIQVSHGAPRYDHPFFLSRGWDPFPLSLAGFFIRRMFWRRAPRLAALVRQLRPDVIHSIELQTESYHVLDAIESLGGSLGAPWIVSTWGSDIFYYQKFPAHLKKIKRLLAMCDYLIPDCARDESLARSYGFRGSVPLILPGAGGYPVDEMRRLAQPGPCSRRRVVAVKGYQGWAGRAAVALDALAACASELEEYEVVVYAASPEIKAKAVRMRATSGLRIRVLPRSPHEDVLALFGKARVALGVNVTDGIPNAMLEAMTMGAFPIQSDTASTSEWIKDGKNGLLVTPEEPATLVSAIRRALLDDSLVDAAAKDNVAEIRARLDASIIKPQVIRLYEDAAARQR